jgi:SAM-dependent methyltransferase
MNRFDEAPRDYNEVLSENLRFIPGGVDYYTEYRAHLARQSTPDPVTSILDFGCGVGNSLPHLRRMFPDASITACDASEPSVEIAKRHHPFVRFVSEAELAPAAFDLVFVAGVIHHVDPADRDRVMRVLGRALAPRGTMTIFELNPLNPVTRRLVSTCVYDDDATLITRTALVRLIGQTEGLTVTHSAFTVFVPPALARLRSLERYLRWCPMGAQYFVTARHG